MEWLEEQSNIGTYVLIDVNVAGLVNEMIVMAYGILSFINQGLNARVGRICYKCSMPIRLQFVNYM